MIDPAGLVAFGNMGKGGGLAAVFNPDTSLGYAETSTGWAGLTLAQPTRIKSAAITSAGNGFDASGSATTITLRLYGKSGAPPVNPSDGVMLASTTFTDVVTTKTLTSADNITLFDHVWISISTGVWAISQYVRFEEATEATAMLPPPNGRTVYTQRLDTEIALPWTLAELTATRWKPLEISTPSSAVVDLTCDFRHTGLGGYDGPVGIGWYFGRRYGTTLAAMLAAPWQAYDDLAMSTQIASLTHHYAPAARGGAIDLPQGFYQFSVSASAHSTASPANGLAVNLVEGGKGLNSARLIVSQDTVHRI